MKLTKPVIKQFEVEQKEYGTGVALSNLIWLLALDILRGIEVRRMQTTYKKAKR